jgi:hypothetical protein
MNSGDVILTVGVELAAVALFTLVAGASDDAGSVVVLFMAGLWLIYLVSDSKVLAGLSNAITNVAQQGANQ